MVEITPYHKTVFVYEGDGDDGPSEIYKKVIRVEITGSTVSIFLEGHGVWVLCLNPGSRLIMLGDEFEERDGVLYPVEET